MSDATNHWPSETKETVPADVALDAVVERLGQLKSELEFEFQRCDEISAENRRLREALDKAIHHADRMERADRARLNAETEKERDEADSAMFDATEDYLIWKEDEALNATGSRDE